MLVSCEVLRQYYHLKCCIIVDCIFALNLYITCKCVFYYYLGLWKHKNNLTPYSDSAFNSNSTVLIENQNITERFVSVADNVKSLNLLPPPSFMNTTKMRHITMLESGDRCLAYKRFQSRQGYKNMKNRHAPVCNNKMQWFDDDDNARRLPLYPRKSPSIDRDDVSFSAQNKAGENHANCSFPLQEYRKLASRLEQPVLKHLSQPVVVPQVTVTTRIGSAFSHMPSIRSLVPPPPPPSPPPPLPSSPPPISPPPPPLSLPREPPPPLRQLHPFGAQGVSRIFLTLYVHNLHTVFY